jgi:hypothetical protein
VPIAFLGQPFGADEQIGRAIRDGLKDESLTRLWVATAWAKRSGLNRIWRPCLAFRERGGESEVIVGIDEGAATKEGLEACLRIFDRTWILKDEGGRIFHPKLFALEGAGRARIVVGSGNMTRGGLFTNFEAAVLIDATESQAEWALRDSIRTYFERLLELEGCVKPLEEELIGRLVAEGRVVSEAQQNQTRVRDRAARRPDDLFLIARGLAGAPAPDVEPLPEEEADADAPLYLEASGPVASARRTEGPEPEFGEPAGTLGFWKALSHFDVSRHAAPGQIIIPRRYLDFFPPLEVEKDESATGGPRQSSAHLGVAFTDGTWTKTVTNARVVLYEPALHHPRSNIEVRFTFRDQEISSRLEQDDVLVFSRTDQGYFVDRRAPGSMGDGSRFGALP